MSQKKILVDSCVYLRLARHVHPFLRQEFGSENYCLYAIPEFEDEYAQQPRLQDLHPWVRDAQYVNNRRGELFLSRKDARRRGTLLLQMDETAFEKDIAVSRVDIKALATALLADIALATDDTGLQELALLYGVDTFGSLKLLHMMFEAGRITREEIVDVLTYLESLPDIPARFWHDRKRLFPGL